MYIINAYSFDISRTADANTLQDFRQEVLADAALDQADRDELCVAIDRRLAFLKMSARNFVPQRP